MRIIMVITMLLVVSLGWANNYSLISVAEPASENAQRDAFMRTLQQVRENFKSADEDGDDLITRGQFRVFVDANAEIDFAMSKQVKRMRAYQRAFKRVDLDGDGTLSWQEYVSVLRNRGGRN